MNREQDLQLLRRRLIRRREKIRSLLRGDLYALTELLDESGDQGDYAAQNAKGHLSSRIIDEENRELADLDAALQRFDESCFGDCGQCGLAIPLERLKVVPQAALCIACQEILEKRSTGHWSDSPVGA